MKMNITCALALSLGMAAAINAAVIQPTGITGNLAGDAGSSVGDLISGSGLSTVLTSGDALATALTTTHVLTGTGHQQSWTIGTGPALPVFSIDLGSEQAFGTALLWQYGNNGGAGQYDAGNHTRQFELIFHTTAEGATFDFDTEIAEFSGTMAYIDGGGADSSATNLAQSFQFASVDAQYVGLRIINNYKDETVDGTLLTGGDRWGLGEVSFASEVVPEPSSAALLGLGGLALILRRRK